MQKAILFSVLLFLSYLTSAQYANTRLWRISGNGLEKSSYLFGSMHVNDERAFNFSDSLFYKMAECEVFANEVSNDSVMKFLYQSLDNSMQKKMQEEYFGDDEDALNEISQSTGLDRLSIKKMSPVVLKQFISGTTSEKARRLAVLDSYLYNIARREGKICIGIEDLNNQISLFERFPKNTQKEYTDYTIGKNRLTKNMEMISIYHNANLQAAEKMLNNMPEDLFKAMFEDRNIGMVKQIDSISHQKSAFYTIGFGHLPGTKGLINLLREKGFNVDPVIETFTGMADKYTFSQHEIPWVTHSDSTYGFAVDMPGKSYTSPSFPSSVAHGINYDIGTNSFFMVMARSSGAFGQVKDMDSLTRTFVQNAWKVNASDLKITKVIQDGLEFMQIDKFKVGQFYLSTQLSIDKDNLFVLVGMNNQPKEMTDITRFFNTFKRIDKILVGWNTFTSEHGAYTINFPGTPNETNINDKNEDSGVSVSMISGSDNATGSEYLVQFIDSKYNYNINDSTALTNIQNSTITSLNGSLQTEESLKFQGFPARKYTIKSENGIVIKIVLLSRGTRTYNLIATYLDSNPDTIGPEKFFNSFRLNPYAYQNWKPQSFAEEKLSMIAPAEFILRDSTNYNSKYSISRTYNSYDALTADKIVLIRQTFSPYYNDKTDSAFFRKQFLVTADVGDTILIQKKISDKPLMWEFTSSNPNNHLLTCAKIILNGRNLYSLLLMPPALYQTEHPAVKAIQSFTLYDTLRDDDINQRKTTLLLTNLTSTDTLASYPAKDALQFYSFTPDEIPLILDCLTKTLNDDGQEDENSRSQLISSLGELPDSLYIDTLKDKFDLLCRNNNSKLEALLLLSRNQDMKNLEFVKQKYLSIPVNTVYRYRFLYQLPDTSQYTAGMFPEILSTLSDTLNRDVLMSLTLEMLRKNMISVDALKSYKTEIVETMKSLIKNPSQLYEGDYLTPKIFDIAGYIGDSEINSFLQKHQQSKNKYIQYNILKSLIRSNLSYKQKILNTIAEDIELREGLYKNLLSQNKTELMPAQYRTQGSLACSHMYNYLISEDDEPIKIAEYDVREMMYKGEMQRFYLLKLYYEWEDGGKETNFSIAGPFPMDGTINDNPTEQTGNYWSTDTKLTASEHFEAFAKTLEDDE